jgi:hypothetical protein
LFASIFSCFSSSSSFCCEVTCNIVYS